EDDEPGRIGEIPFPAKLSNVGLPTGVRRVRGSGRVVALPYLGADRPCRGADGGLDAVGRSGDEVGRLWLSARGDDLIPARIGCVDCGCLWPCGSAFPGEPFAHRKPPMDAAPFWFRLLARCAGPPGS